MIKILITCVGRRVELIQAFQHAARTLKEDVYIIGSDSSDTAPALFFCDKKEVVCKIGEKEYIPSLLEICKKEKVDALVPTIDTDLLLISKNRHLFEELGVKVFVSDEDKIAICRDKRLTAVFFKNIGLKTPYPIDDVTKYDLGFPAFIKPKDGSSSINAFKVNDFDELKDLAKRVPDYIIEPFVDGTEYTVDAFCDLEGNPILITPRIRLAVRSGEVLKTQICNDRQIIKETKTIIAHFKPHGAITVQLIRKNGTMDDFFIEMNPRFGGGAPLSIKAGADSAQALLSVVLGKKQSFKDNAAEDGAIYSRFDQSVRVK